MMNTPVCSKGKPGAAQRQVNGAPYTIFVSWEASWSAYDFWRCHRAVTLTHQRVHTVYYSLACSALQGSSSAATAVELGGATAGRQPINYAERELL
eukprot:1765677-Amphidinium_carterae.1